VAVVGAKQVAEVAPQSLAAEWLMAEWVVDFARNHYFAAIAETHPLMERRRLQKVKKKLAQG